MSHPTLAPMAERLIVGGDELHFRVTSDVSGGEVVAYDVRLAPGGGPPALHRHAAFELVRVERGELTLYIEDGRGAVRRSVAGPGAVIAIPGGREHTIRNESAEDAQAFMVLSPGAQMERFARAAGELGARGTPTADQVLAVAAAHGIEITRPLGELS